MATTAYPINPALSAIAIGYKNRDIDLIADIVMPRVPVAYKFNYTQYTAADAYTVPTTRVGRRSEPTMVDFGGTLVAAECQDWGLDDMVANLEIEAWNQMPKPPTAVGPLEKATSLLTGLLMLAREIRVAGKVFIGSTYNVGLKTTLSGTSQWNDFTNSNPLNDMLAALDLPIMRPNTVILGQAVWTQVRQHPKVIQGVYGTAQTGGSVNREQLAALLEVKRVVVGAGFANTANMGQTPVYSRVWGKNAALIYVSEDQANADQPTFCFTGQFGERIAGEMDEPRNGLRGSTRVRVGESLTEIVSAPECGYFFASAVA